MSFSRIIILLTAYKYFFLFPIVVVEGPVITVIAGWLASMNFLNLFITYCVVVVGDLTGDSVSYMLGRWGRISFIERWGKYIGLHAEKIIKLEHHFGKHSAKTIILGKLAYSLEMPFLIAAGMAKVPYQKFIFYAFVPTVFKSFFFILIGYYFGQAYIQLGEYLNFTSVIMGTLAIMLIIIYFIIKKISQKYAEEK
ncbi:MAG: DedA family protein [Patescibacteria group bacterium]